MVTIYGIKNCDTMKKAFQWFDNNNVSYEFHDYKKLGINKETLRKAINIHGWDIVINKKGTTWRQLSDNDKTTMSADKALLIADESPSIVKRPIVTHNDTVIVGFNETILSKIFL